MSERRYYSEGDIDQFQTETKKRVQDAYPNIHSETMKRSEAEIMEKFSKGIDPFRFVTFDTSKGIQNRIVRKTLQIALQRAADSSDPAYGRHADVGHETFYETLGYLIDDVGKAGVDWEFYFRAPEKIEEKGKIRHRLVVDSRVRIRPVNRPFVYRWLMEKWSMYGDAKSIEEFRRRVVKVIRGTLTSGGAEGRFEIGFGVLAASYFGMPSEEIWQVFGRDDSLKRSVESQGYSSISVSRAQDKQKLRKIVETLMQDEYWGARPRYDPNSYQTALDLMENFDWIKGPDRLKPHFRSKPGEEVMWARGVFLGAMEAAQLLAPPNFPAESLRIFTQKNYSTVSTSRMITAYIMFEKMLPNWMGTTSQMRKPGRRR